MLAVGVLMRADLIIYFALNRVRSYSGTSVGLRRSSSRRLSSPWCQAVFQAACRARRAGARVSRSEAGGSTQRYGLTAWWLAAWNGRLYLGDKSQCFSSAKEETLPGVNMGGEFHLRMTGRGRENGARVPSLLDLSDLM